MSHLHRSATAPAPAQALPSGPLVPITAGPVHRSGQNITATPPRLSPTSPNRPMRRSRSAIEIEKFAENEGDADFSDIFLPDDSVTDRDESDHGSEAGGDGLMLMSKISGDSWLGDDDDEHDPFASLDQGFDQMDLEANIARDRHARLSERVELLVRSLSLSGSEDDDRSDYAAELVSLFVVASTPPAHLFPDSEGRAYVRSLNSCTKTRPRLNGCSFPPTACFPSSRYWSRARQRQDTAWC